MIPTDSDDNFATLTSHSNVECNRFHSQNRLHDLSLFRCVQRAVERHNYSIASTPKCPVFNKECDLLLEFCVILRRDDPDPRLGGQWQRGGGGGGGGQHL